MKTLLLQVIVIICAIAAIGGVKMMDLEAWLTYPLLAIVTLLTILGLALAHYGRKST